MISSSFLELEFDESGGERRVRLGVHVDQQHPATFLSQRYGKIDRDSGFSHAALVVIERDDLHAPFLFRVDRRFVPCRRFRKTRFALDRLERRVLRRSVVVSFFRCFRCIQFFG